MNRAGGHIIRADDDLRICLAADGDAEALAALGRDTFIETFGHLYRPEDLHDYLAKAYDLAAQREALRDATLYNIIAQVDTELAGYAKAGPCRLPVETGMERAYELNRLYVRARYHRRGIGDALMQAVIERARLEGADALYLGMWEKNERAYAFYSRYGFSEVGEYVFYVGAKADRELILRMPLSSAPISCAT